jgi:hypothetical protein
MNEWKTETLKKLPPYLYVHWRDSMWVNVAGFNARLNQTNWWEWLNVFTNAGHPFTHNMNKEGEWTSIDKQFCFVTGGELGIGEFYNIDLATHKLQSSRRQAQTIHICTTYMYICRATVTHLVYLRTYLCTCIVGKMELQARIFIITFNYYFNYYNFNCPIFRSRTQKWLFSIGS